LQYNSKNAGIGGILAILDSLKWKTDGKCGFDLRRRKDMIDKENTSSAQRAENRRKTGKPTRAARLAEIGKCTRFKSGQKSANPNGRPRTAKFSEAVRQIAQEINPATGETNAETLARHTFKRAIAGSVRHQELLLNYGEGKPMQGLEISGPSGSPMRIASMTEAEIDARLAELLGSMTDAQLLASAARVFPVPATAIDNSTVASALATPPLPVPAAKAELTGEERDKAFFDHLTGSTGATVQ
jgi:hypothetical protein